MMQRYTEYICLIPITLGNGVSFLMDRKQSAIVANSVMTMVRPVQKIATTRAS